MIDRVGLAISDEFLRWHWQRDVSGRLHIVRDDDNGTQVQMDSSREFSLFKVADLQHFGRLRREATARAAVAAMRTPSPEMKSAGGGSNFDEWYNAEDDLAVEVWESMVDVILQEPTNHDEQP